MGSERSKPACCREAASIVDGGSLNLSPKIRGTASGFFTKLRLGYPADFGVWRYLYKEFAAVSGHA